MPHTRTYSAHGLAGCVTRTRSRDTGFLVGVYRADQAGLDDCDGESPWSTVCEEHGGVCAHQTLALARAFAASPREWCEDCREPGSMDPYGVRAMA